MTRAELRAYFVANWDTDAWIDEVVAAGVETQVHKLTLAEAVRFMARPAEGHSTTKAFVICSDGAELDCGACFFLYRDFREKLDGLPREGA